MTPRKDRYRNRDWAESVVGFSISYQHDAMLARGFGLEHMREMLIRLARHLLRQGASLAYGGNWKVREDNFTYDLLQLVSGEREDTSLTDPGITPTIGLLYNHAAWPHYLEITPQIEAQWINCCRISRITQLHAGFVPDEIVSDTEVAARSSRVLFNAACTMSAMRRCMNTRMEINIPDAQPVVIPQVDARIMLGGKTVGFSGFMPGIFEETLTTLGAQGRPLYLLGGFGGATGILTKAMLSKKSDPPAELTVDWNEDNTAGYAELLESLRKFRLPNLEFHPAIAFEQLWQKLLAARDSLAASLNTGLTDAETIELMTTNDPYTAIRLVRSGLAKNRNSPPLP